MKLSKTQKEIIYGLVLGDGFLQPTGRKNARLRIEHSAKQKEYIDWLYRQLPNIFAAKPRLITRPHPLTKKTYYYYRLQSNSSPILGKLREQFYQGNKKIIPEKISYYLKSPLTLAVWYMDDGYYYRRDKSAHIYIQKLDQISQNRLIKWGENNFGQKIKIYCRPDRRACQINFVGPAKNKLFALIYPRIIPAFNYKLPSNPVSTESENKSEY